MNLYTKTETGRSFTGEVLTENMSTIIFVDGVKAEHLPYEEVHAELNRELLFLGHKGLTDYIETLRNVA